MRDIGTGPTGHAKTNQFKEPDLVGAHKSLPFSRRETSSRIRTAQVRLLPLGQQTQELRPSGYDETISHEKEIRLSSSAQTDAILDVVASRKMMTDPALGAWPSLSAPPKAANPPYVRSRSTIVTSTRQYVLLLRIMLAEYRTTWFFHVFGGLLIPISIAFLIVAVGGAASPELVIYLLGGNMALSIATGPATFLISKMGWAQQSREFEYWIALPVSKLLLVLAIVSVALVFSLPGILGSYVFGSLLLGLPFSGAFWTLIPLIPLGVLPLAGVGALLGTVAPNGQTADVLSNLLILFVGILSPVVLPLESLPVPLRIIAPFMPTTYVADAFRAVLGGRGTNLAFDLIALVLFSVVFLTITYFRLDWRNT